MAPKSVLRRRVDGFRHAVRGLWFLVASQVHARFHLLATLVVVIAGLLLQVTQTEWCLLSFSIGLVWTTEAVNTAIEVVVDLASPEFHDLAGRSKDIAAGAVLLAAITAAVVGALVFVPRAMAFWQ